jgi:hypothetical protein
MMKAKEVRRILDDRKATWQLLPHIADEADITEVFKAHPVGLRPTPPGTLTARLPRIRRAEDAAIRGWQPLLLPALRPVSAALPDSWDWRHVQNQNWITPPRSQGGCGSCVAFGTAGALETHWRLKKAQANLPMDLSEASLFFVNNRQCIPGDPHYGWWIEGALDALVEEGICAEENYPYQDHNQTALLPEGTERTLKITGYDSTTNASQMKRWLVEEGPLVTGYTVYQDFDAYWGGGAGVYTHTWGALRGGHVVMTIGYDDNQSCWICKNSWGAPAAHADGCFLIGYGQCGIDNRMFLIQDPYEVFTVDELPYNPTRLRIVDEGANGWLLTDGRSRMKMLATKEDARNALRVARRYTRHGFVGRDNARSNRRDYINEYWAGNSGLPWEPLTRTDAISYNPNNVVAEDLDAKGWRIRDGNHWMLLAHDMNDALAILRIVERYSKICFIGRGNTMPDRKRFIMTYWE